MKTSILRFGISPKFIAHQFTRLALGFFNASPRHRVCASTRVRVYASLLLLVSFTAQAFAVNLPTAQPAAVGMSAARLAEIDKVVEQSIAGRELPGAVVLVARRGRVVWRKAYGARATTPAREAMTADTIFDVASFTKIVATATSIMILIERGQVRLSDPVTLYIPELKGEGRERITIEMLLTHRSGFAADFDLGERWMGYEEALKRLYREPLRSAPDTRFIYSDLGYIALGEVVRRTSGMTLDEFARKNIFEPLKMRDTGFRLRGELKGRVAPTETRRATLNYLGGSAEGFGPEQDYLLRGEVHDPTAFRMAGVAGHAGLFSTVDDLAVYCQMILNGGEYGGARILSPMGVAAMTRPRAITDEGDARGLGWDMTSSFAVNRGDIFPPGSFGHTGFTGTSMWVDPSSETFVLFMSSRLHPDGKGDVANLRGRISSIVASAVLDTPVGQVRDDSSRFAAEVLTSLARLSSSGVGPTSATVERNAPVNAQVLTGIDILERDGFAQLKGLRVGLVTNNTGRNRSGKPTIDVLHNAAGVKLAALFAPEHGIRGLADEKVSDAKDEKTGLPIYSLYGENRRPQAAQLKDLDAIVFDIQDIGTRFYTYISTLGYVMEEAARARIPVFVLDRPNPINGTDVEGPVADADKLSFTAYHRLPVRHGMTIGEIARLYNNARKMNCDLRVVKMENYRRSMWFDATNLTWVNPSPNMRSLTQATIYPGIGLLEMTNLSVGRGTDTPFEVVGAPWLDGQRLASLLNERGLAGVRFVPVRFTPKASIFKNEECNGINIIVTDRTQFRPVLTGLEIALALRKLYPAEWKVDDYARLLVSAETFERIKRADMPEEIVRSWMSALNEFRAARSQALLYR